MNGVTSLLESFPEASKSNAIKQKFMYQKKCTPLSKACYLCLLVAHSCKALYLLHPLLNMQWQHSQMHCW